MRKLATIRKIAEVKIIENADKICQYRVDGWWVVDAVERYQVGDLVVYFEIDSWVPTELAPFLSKGKEPREYGGVKGERLKTVKLRGAVSQGLLLPVETGFGGYPWIRSATGEHTVVQEGQDVTELLGIQKYEPPVPAQLAGKIAGVFPSWLRKTDQERCCDANTKVLTEAGPMSIKQICDEKYSGQVLSFNHATEQTEFKPVTGWSTMTRRKGEWLKITTRSGKTLLVTKNHKIYLPEIGVYREARELSVGDLVNILG